MTALEEFPHMSKSISVRRKYDVKSHHEFTPLLNSSLELFSTYNINDGFLSPNQIISPATNSSQKAQPQRHISPFPPLSYPPKHFSLPLTELQRTVFPVSSQQRVSKWTDEAVEEVRDASGRVHLFARCTLHKGTRKKRTSQR